MMKVLGYIVCKCKLPYILPCIKVLSSYRLIDDFTKPILIIGLEEAKKHASSFSILDKKIGEKTFWTFGKREKRVDFEKDIEEFQEFVLKDTLNDIQYYYFNILTVSLTKVKKLLDIILHRDNNVIFLEKKMIYLYRDNYIIGISCDMLEYIGLPKRKVLMFLKRNALNKLYFNDFTLDYKIRNLINDKNYVIPYLMSLNLLK